MNTELNEWLDNWIRPIREDAPAGDDVSFSDVFDTIRESRRSDDPNLSQGEWEHELKVANWREVIKLAGDVLETRSKDLQAAVWLGEALIAQHRLDGARAGCQLLAQLLDTYWDDLYPRIEGDDLEERAAKLAWFNEYAAQAIARLRLTPGEEAYTLLDWQVSREVDNLARQNADAHMEAVAEGKPTGEMFDRAVESNADASLLQDHDDAAQALAAFEQLKSVVDARLGRDAPSLARLQDAIKRVQQIITKAARSKGLLGTETAGTTEPEGQEEAATGIAGATGARSLNLNGFDAANKAAAVRALGEIAAWFKRAEPHSPVSYLLERAVAWADTPLEEWLNEVVGDPTTLAAIRSRIGLSG